jgi:hypothetical protein
MLFVSCQSLSRDLTRANLESAIVRSRESRRTEAVDIHIMCARIST